MSKLIDIKGYLDISYNNDFDNSNMFNGKLLLEEDGWFEGIIINSKKVYTGDRMIFGVYYPNKIIELINVSPINVCHPLILRGKKNEIGYEGRFYALGLFGIKEFGLSRIITHDIENSKENNLKKEDLIKRITIFKENNNYNELYEKILKIREPVSKIVLNELENTFAEEEYLKLLLKIKPIQNETEMNTINEVKRLIKNKNK